MAGDEVVVTLLGGETHTFTVGGIYDSDLAQANTLAFVTSPETVVVVGNPVVPPVAPYGLAVTKAGGTLTFAWAAPSIGTAPFSYRLEAGSAPGLSNLATVPVGATTFSAAGVPPGVYYIRVRAIGAGGVGPVSNELVVAVP